MADFSRQSVDLPTSQPPNMSVGDSPVTENDEGHPTNGAGAIGTTSDDGPELSKQVQDVLGSDVRLTLHTILPPRRVLDHANLYRSAFPPC